MHFVKRRRWDCYSQFVQDGPGDWCEDHSKMNVLVSWKAMNEEDQSALPEGSQPELGHEVVSEHLVGIGTML